MKKIDIEKYTRDTGSVTYEMDTYSLFQDIINNINQIIDKLNTLAEEEDE